METEANDIVEDDESGGEAPESHRGFVREIARGVSFAYGLGGTAVLAILAGLLTWGFMAGHLLSPLLWIGTIVAGLTGLFVVRMVVYRRADSLYQRLESYCEANALEPSELRSRYADVFPFFEALFDLRERRQRIREGKTPDPEDDSS